MTDSRVVTAEDIKVVTEDLIRRDTGILRVIGLISEIFGWVTVAGAALYAGLQWDLVNSGDGVFGRGRETEFWQQFGTFVLPGFLNLAVGGVILVVLGRGTRLLALHFAARRGINLTGLTLGEPLDLSEDTETYGDSDVPDEPWPS